MLVRYYTQVPVPGRNGRAVKLKLAGQGQHPFYARRLPAGASTSTSTSDAGTGASTSNPISDAGTGASTPTSTSDAADVTNPDGDHFHS